MDGVKLLVGELSSAVYTPEIVSLGVSFEWLGRAGGLEVVALEERLGVVHRAQQARCA